MLTIKAIETEVDFVARSSDGSGRLHGDNYLGAIITLSDDSQIKFGIRSYQDCCENWGYLHSPDDVQEVVGGRFLSLEEVDNLSPAAKEALECEGVHDDSFQAMRLVTSKGTVDFVVYNEHNGYYSHDVILVMMDDLVMMDAKVVKSSL